MYPFARLLTWLGIISLTFGILLGCAERRVHVSTASGKPGEATGHDGGNADLSGLKGLSGERVDESGLGGQATPAEESPAVDTAQSTASEVMPPEEVQVARNETTSDLQPQLPGEATSETSPSQEAPPAQVMDGLLPLTEGQHLQAQSGSSGKDAPTLPEIELEQIPATFQVANVEPSETGRQRLEEMKRQELATAAAELEDVFFQFDSWSLTPEGKQALERDMGYLQNDAAANLLIEGHADQRGTQAYNLILGKRRASAIRDYLSEMGVDPQRLAVISYGKDKPFCLDPTEVCYQLNRRGHLLVQNPQ